MKDEYDDTPKEGDEFLADDSDDWDDDDTPESIEARMGPVEEEIEESNKQNWRAKGRQDGWSPYDEDADGSDG